MTHVLQHAFSLVLLNCMPHGVSSIGLGLWLCKYWHGALQDIEYSYEHFKAFFQDFTALDTHTDFDSLSPPDIQGTMIDTPCGHLQ